LIAKSIETLAGAGAAFAVCPENTVHIGVPFMGATSIPLLHIVQVVAAEANARGFKRVGVLGTRFTMESTLYPDALGAFGIAAVTPTADERTIIDEAIWRELVKGLFTDETRRAYQTVIDSLRARGCDSVALACTEIPLLIAPSDSSLPTLDSTRLLAAAALKRSLDLAHAV
jgi:aspartate racemase